MSLIKRDDNHIIGCKEFKFDKFSIKNFYSFLVWGRVKSFLIILVWNSWIPIKKGFFSWEATWGRILTINKLKKRG